VDSTINLTPLDHIIRDEQDYESTPPDRYERYSSSPSFDTFNNAIFSTDQNIIRRGVMGDSSLSDPAPKTGMLAVCSGMPPVETGPRHKGGKFLAPSLLTTPRRSNAWSPPGGGIELEGEENATLVSRSAGLFRPDRIGSSFTPRFNVDRENYPSGVETGIYTPFTGRRDRSPTPSESSGQFDKLTDVLELIAKRLESLENRKYFSSPERENKS